MNDFDPNFLSSIEDVIEDAKKGKMFILVDDEDRENEGDLCILAEYASAETINFMAKHGRGLICLALERTKIESLGLEMMQQRNPSRLGTAFTISIEAADGEAPIWHPDVRFFKVLDKDGYCCAFKEN